VILSGTASSILDEQRQLFSGQPHFGQTRPAPVAYTVRGGFLPLIALRLRWEL